MTKRAIASFAEGDEHQALAKMTWPLQERYARKHGASWISYHSVPRHSRPPAWSKLIVIADALREHDEVLWLDADVVVYDSGDNIFEAVPERYWHALVEHTTDEGTVPNTGVWLVRKAMLPYLVVAAMLDCCVHHKWWEQAAILLQLGYEVGDDGICKRTATTPLFCETYFLPQEWNYCRFSNGEVVSFIHPCGNIGQARYETIQQAVKDAI